MTYISSNNLNSLPLHSGKKDYQNNNPAFWGRPSDGQDTFALKEKKPDPPSLLKKVLTYFSEESVFERKMNEVNELLESEFARRGLNKDKIRLNLFKTDRIADISFNYNSGAILFPENNFSGKNINIVKASIIHEVTHAGQFALISLLPKEHLGHLNKLLLQEILLRNDQLKKVVKETKLKDINEDFIRKYCKYHPGDYIIETIEDMKYVKNEFIGLKSLLDNPNILENQLPMSINIEYLQSLRNNKPLDKAELEQGMAYIKSREEGVKKLVDIANGKAPLKDYKGNELSPEHKKVRVYFEDLMEQQAYDAQFSYLKSSSFIKRIKLESYEKQLKAQRPIDYYIYCHDDFTI